MNQSIRTILITAAALAIFVQLGILVGQGEILLPVLAGIICLVVGGFKLVIPGVNPGASCLAFLVFGYLVGNRGFASLGLFVVYIGEVGMLLATVFVLLSQRFKFFNGFRGLLGGLVFALLAIGGIRLSYDLLGPNNVDTMDAIRDSAASYYAWFFPLGFGIALLPKSQAFMIRALRWSCLVSLVVGMAYYFREDWFYTPAFRGRPLIQFKGDLLGMCFGIGVATFGTAALGHRSRVMAGIFAGLFFMAATACMMGQSRAAYLGVAAGILVMFLAAGPGYFVRRFLPSGIIAGVVGVVVLMSLLNIPKFQTRAEEIWETSTARIETIISPFDEQVDNDATQMARQNSRFRIAWWTAVVEEVYERNLFFGIGFGEPIALKRFVSTYELPLDIEDDEAVVRSPHSIAFTLFGRFGLVGAAWVLVFLGAIINLAWRSVRAVHRGVMSYSDLTALAVALVVLVTSMFGVVMEGPMGGIPFWTFLGLAYGTLRRSEAHAAANAAAAAAVAASEPAAPSAPAGRVRERVRRERQYPQRERSKNLWKQPPVAEPGAREPRGE
jgi:hypothetical protein